MRLAAMMAQSITDRRHECGAEQSPPPATEAGGPVTFAIANHRRDYRQALRHHNAARKASSADAKETWKDLRWGCHLQELVSDFGMGLLAMSPAALRLRNGAIGLRDFSVEPYLQWRATMRADATFVKFAKMMTLALRELLQSAEPAETRGLLPIEGAEAAAAPSSASENVPGPPHSAVELLDWFSRELTVGNMRLVSEPERPLLPSADQPD